MSLKPDKPAELLAQSETAHEVQPFSLSDFDQVDIFKNTLFSYTLRLDGIEQFVATPELHSDEAIVLSLSRQVRSGRSARAAEKLGPASIGSRSRRNPALASVS